MTGGTYCRIGQGNGAGPAIWAAVSTPLFSIMNKNDFFAMIVCTISKKGLLLAGFIFVDDIDLCITQELNDTKPIHSKMQGAVTQWEGVL